MSLSLRDLWCIPLIAAAALVALLYARKTASYTRESFIDWLARFGKAFNDWNNTIRQANFKANITVMLYVGTFFIWGLAVLREKEIEITAFGLWLGFLAALGGFSLKQFKDERTTDYGYVDRQAEIEKAKRSGAPSTTVNAPGSAVDVAAPATVSPPAQGS